MRFVEACDSVSSSLIEEFKVYSVGKRNMMLAMAKISYELMYYY